MSQSSSSHSHGNGGHGDKINLNTAGKQELMQIPGVGDKQADEILNYRKEHGRIQNVNELDQLWRISGKSLDQIRQSVQV